MEEEKYDIWKIIRDNMQRIIHDKEPVKIEPFITKALVGLNTLIFTMTVLILNQIIEVYGLIPARVLSGEFWLLFTSMYLHINFIEHLGINMTFLYVFGDNVEELTTWRYIVYYHFFGLGAGFVYILYALANPTLMYVPVVGASGAVSGVLGYYVARLPEAKVVFLGREMQAYKFISIFFIEQIVLSFMTTNIAWPAHLGGLFIGLGLGLWDKRRK